MTFKPTLQNKPSDYSLLASYANDKPLPPDVLNFLAWHEKTLSYLQPGLDQALRYHLKPYHKHREEAQSFLLTHEKLNKESIANLKKRLQIMLQDRNSHLEFKMKPEQFLQFRSMTVDELILYHGNQFLTGAPFHIGGIPHTLLFQWGNLFGVAKYVVLPEERALRSNVLIYFESMHDRYLDQCVDEYQHKLKNELQHHTATPAPQLHHLEHTQTMYSSTPRLTLSRSSQKEDEK